VRQLIVIAGNQAYRTLFAEVARRGACEVWNFAPIELPDAFFRDVSHLNREGRAQ
jgi:chitinase